MFKFVTLVAVCFSALLGITFGSVVLPDNCPGVNATGMALVVYVTNNDNTNNTLDPNAPYSLIVGQNYTVVYTFVPTTTENITEFRIVASYNDTNNVPQNLTVATQAVPPFNATSVPQMVAGCTGACANTLLKIITKCSLPLPNSIPALNSCASDALVNELGASSNTLATASITFTMPDVPTPSGYTVFQGFVTNSNNQTVACKQGTVMVIYPPPQP